MDKRNKIEFEVGEGVTYFPYEKSFDVVIEKVDVIPVGLPHKDERIFYKFKLQNITVSATGRCIKESIYFEKFEDNAWHGILLV